MATVPAPTTEQLLAQLETTRNADTTTRLTQLLLRTWWWSQ